MITHGQVYPVRFSDNTLEMREGFEAFPAVISAHAAVADTPEGHVRISKMDDGVIDAAASEGEAGKYKLFNRPVPGEQVEGQGGGPGSDHINGLAECVVDDDWQDRPKDFLLHNRRSEGDIVEDGRFNETARGVRAAAVPEIGREHV